jgi:protein-tyrosine phosphatase
MAIRILFVCLGNICRSPAAEGVMQHLLTEEGLADQVVLDSAGTGAWHQGQAADRRMRQAAARRGIQLTSIARQVTAADFEHFDHIFAMDASNLADLHAMAPIQPRARMRLFRDLDPDGPGQDVPDPYYGEADGFDEVLDIVTRASRALLAELKAADTRDPGSTRR